MEVVLADMLGESAHLFYADAGVGGELDPDSADLGERVRIRGCRERGILRKHSISGFEGGGHFLPAVSVCVSWAVPILVYWAAQHYSAAPFGPAKRSRNSSSVMRTSSSANS